MKRRKMAKRVLSISLAALMLGAYAGTALPQYTGTEITANAAFIAGTGWVNDCEPYQWSSSKCYSKYQMDDDKSFKIAGNEYSEGYFIERWYGDETPTIAFNTDGKFDSFSFDFAKLDDTPSIANATINVYYDGVLSDKIEYDSSLLPQHINLKIAGVKQLKFAISVHISGGYSVQYAIFNGVWNKNGTSGQKVGESVWLKKCQPYETGKSEFYIKEEDRYVYMGGKAFTDAIRFNPDYTNGRAYASFNLDGRYDNFEFTLGHVDNTTITDTELSVIIDGEIVEKIPVQGWSLPQKYKIALNKAKQLTIEEKYTYISFVTTSRSIAVAEANFTKNESVDISDCDVTLDSDTFIYDGSAIEPKIIVTDGIYTLAKDIDYTISYKNNIDAGTAKAVIKGKGDYKGTIEKTFTVNQCSLKSAVVSNIEEQTYTGSALKPNITVKCGDKKLVKNTDYTVTYKNNTEPGEASVVIKGKNNYSGSVTKKFKIFADNPTDISLNKVNMKTTVGDTFTLTATLSPSNTKYIRNAKITWTTSNSKVAVVSNGKVTIKGGGTAVITAKTSGGKTATCSITANQPVTSVKLSKTSLSLEKGKTQTITATITPSDASDKTVTWSTSNSKVATVSNGKITAVSNGTATITAKTSNGKTASCKVIVTTPVSSVKLSKTSLTLVKGTSETITATITPSNASDKTVTWTTSNSKVATVSNGKITAKSDGTATITVKTSNGKTASCEVTVKTPTAPKDNGSKLVDNAGVGGGSVSTWVNWNNIVAKANFKGEGGWKYKYSYKNDKDNKWIDMTGYVTNSSYRLPKFTKAGNYTIRIAATDKYGQYVSKYTFLTVKQNTNAALKNSASKLSSTNVSKGQTITASAKFTGGVIPYRYKYAYKKDSGAWVEIKQPKHDNAIYSTDDNFSFKLPSQSGRYTVKIVCRDGAGKTASKDITVTVR